MSAPAASPKPAKYERWIKVISALAVIVYLVAVQQIWGWHKIWQAWQQIGFGMVGLALLGMLLTHLVRTWRIQRYFRRSAGIIPFRRLFLVSQTHNLLNNLLPLRSGEISFPLLMKREFEVSMLHSGAGLLWMRLLDLHTLVLVALGVWLWQQAFPSVARLAIWSLVAVLPLLGYGLKQWLLGMTEPYLAKSGSISQLAKLLHKIGEGTPNSSIAFAETWLLTWANWLIKIAVMGALVALLLSVSQSLPTLPLLAGVSGAIGGEVSAILPIAAPAGVGTYAGGVFVGIHAILPDVDGALLAGVNLHMLVMISALSGVLLAYMLKPRSTTKKQKEYE